MQNYRRIFEFNFWLSTLLFLSHFYYVVCVCNSLISNDDKKWWNIREMGKSYGIGKFMSYIFAIFPLPYMIVREKFQFDENEGKTFKQKFEDHFSLHNFDNIAEAFLMISIFICVFVDLLNLDSRSDIIFRLSVVNILVMLGILVTMYPYSTMYFSSIN